MVKKHHPQNRAERLARKKQEFNDSPKEKSAKVRRKYIESLKERETDDELREASDHRTDPLRG